MAGENKYTVHARLIALENDMLALHREFKRVLVFMGNLEVLLKGLEDRDKLTREYLEFLRARREMKK